MDWMNPVEYQQHSWNKQQNKTSWILKRCKTVLDLSCWCPSFLLLFFRCCRLVSGSTRTNSHARFIHGRMQNPAPGKRFYCQDQVGEKAKVGVGRLVISLGKGLGDWWRWKRCLYRGHESPEDENGLNSLPFFVDFGNIPWIHEPVLSLRAHGKSSFVAICIFFLDFSQNMWDSVQNSGSSHGIKTTGQLAASTSEVKRPLETPRWITVPPQKYGRRTSFFVVRSRRLKTDRRIGVGWVI